MWLKDLFFHIHYCNSREGRESGNETRSITRTLQHHELICFSSGKGHIAIGKKKYLLEKDMLFYICPAVMHSIEIDGSEPLCFQSVHFSYGHVYLADNHWEIKNETRLLPLHEAQVLKDHYQVNDLFHKLVSRLYAKQPGYEFAAKILLQQLIAVIFETMKKQNQKATAFLKIEQVIECMQQHIDCRITLRGLSDLVKLSPAYLSRIFKDTTGYTVIAFFNRMKIDKAKALLVESDKKIKEIAEELGFTDEFYFSRVLKKIEGMSPSEFYSKNVHGI